MILFCLLFSIEIDAKIDSLKTLLNEHPQIGTVIQLNKCYIQKGDFNKGITLLKGYEKQFASKEQAIILYTIGDDYFFAGSILQARDEYLKLVGRFPHSEIANNALERLYLIEQTRKDTASMKRLAYSICLYETEQFDEALDSLKTLLKKKLGAYAYYYLALLYNAKDELSLAIAAIGELNRYFPDHKIHNVFLLLAEINLKMDNKKDAQKILEELMVKQPNSIYAIRARKLLKENP